MPGGSRLELVGIWKHVDPTRIIILLFLLLLLLLFIKSNQGGTGKRGKKGEESIKSNQSRQHQLATKRTGRMEIGAGRRKGQNGSSMIGKECAAEAADTRSG